MGKDIKKILKKFLHYEGSSIQKYRKKREEKLFKKKKGELMKKIGLEELDLFFKTAKKCNIKVWLEFGTLLGAYREHAFIPYDYDLDVGMIHSDYTLDFENELLSNGFIKQRVFYKKDMNTNSQILTEITLCYKGFNIDIFLSFPETDKRRVSLYTVPPREADMEDNYYCIKEFLLPNFTELVEVNIVGKNFYSPGDPVENLKTIYGDHFMTPDPNWVTTRSEYNIVKYDYSKVRGLMMGSWNN